VPEIKDLRKVKVEVFIKTSENEKFSEVVKKLAEMSVKNDASGGVDD